MPPANTFTRAFNAKQSEPYQTTGMSVVCAHSGFFLWNTPFSINNLIAISSLFINEAQILLITMNNFTIKPFYTISTFTDHFIKPLAFPLRKCASNQNTTLLHIRTRPHSYRTRTHHSTERTVVSIFSSPPPTSIHTHLPGRDARKMHPPTNPHSLQTNRQNARAMMTKKIFTISHTSEFSSCFILHVRDDDDDDNGETDVPSSSD